MKRLFFFCTFLSLFFSAYSQQRGNYASSVGLSGGYVEDGYGIMATYNYHLSRNDYAQLSILVAIAEDRGTFNIPYNVFTIQPGY